MSWNHAHLRNPSKAPVPVSRSALNNEKDLSDFPFLQLSSELRTFQQGELISESYFSFRTYVANYNQHLQTLHFKKFRQLIQILKRIKETEISDFSRTLLEQFFNSESVSKERKNCWSHLPDPEYTKHALLKFTGIYHLSLSCIKMAEEVSNAYLFIIKRQHFLHTSAFILGLASRIKRIMKIWERGSKIIITALRIVCDLYQKPLTIPKRWNIPEFSPEELSRKKITVRDIETKVQDKKQALKTGQLKSRSIRIRKSKS